MWFSREIPFKKFVKKKTLKMDFSLKKFDVQKNLKKNEIFWKMLKDDFS